MAPLHRLPAYDETQEPLPSQSCFSSTFQGALNRGQILAGQIATALERYTFAETAEIAAFVEKAKALSNFAISDTRTIALIGDTGNGKLILFLPVQASLDLVGKSSSINSLLNYTDIAETVS